MPSVRFEPATPAIKLLQTYALDRTAIEVGASPILPFLFFSFLFFFLRGGSVSEMIL